MDSQTRIRINLNSREVEWEGSEAFIEKYQSTINEFIEKLKSGNIVSGATPSQVHSQTVKVDDKENIPATRSDETFLVPESFGEFYTQFSRNASVSEKMLMAGYFVQAKSQDGLFLPKEASALLNEQNILVTNANAFIKSLQKTGKLYKQAGKFKIHEKGIEYLRGIYKQL